VFSQVIFRQFGSATLVSVGNKQASWYVVMPVTCSRGS